MPLQGESKWLYSQIYFLHPDKNAGADPLALRSICDQLVVEVIPEMVTHFRDQQWIEQFFFIRYAEGGYHLRLRLKGAPAHLDGPVRRHLETAVAGFFTAHQALLWPAGVPLTAQTLLDHDCLRYATYEPELAKYGGIAGLSVAEAHFELSSRLSFRVLEAERRTNISRSQFALELMDILLSEFGAKPHEKAFLLRAYTAYWMGMVEPRYHEQIVTAMEENYQQRKSKLVRRFQQGKPGALEERWQGQSPNLFQLWRNHLQDILAQLKELELAQQLDSPIRQHTVEHQALLHTVPTINGAPTVALLILPNYVHMLNNRLGLTPLQEVQLAYLLYRHLEDTYGATSDSLYTLILEPNLPAITLPAA